MQFDLHRRFLQRSPKGPGSGGGGPQPGSTNSTQPSGPPPSGNPPPGGNNSKPPENCPKKNDTKGGSSQNNNNDLRKTNEEESPWVFRTYVAGRLERKFGVPLKYGRPLTNRTASSLNITYSCSSTLWNKSAAHNEASQFLFDIILFSDFLWVYVILPVTILFIHRLYYHFRLFVAAMISISMLKFYLGIRFALLYFMWDLGHINDVTKKSMFWLDGLLCMVFLMVAHTMRYLLNKFNDGQLGLKGVSDKLMFVENTLGLNGVLAWFWCIFRERDLGSRHLCELDIYRNVLSVVILLAFVGVYIYQRGWKLLKSQFSGRSRFWRQDWGELVLLPRVDAQLIRKEIELNKKNLVLYNDVVINMTDMKIFHYHQTYLNRFISTNIAPVFEGERYTLVGLQRHSGEALKMLKQLARCRLTSPVQVKYPRNGADAFMRQELVQIAESTMIGEQGFYHVVLRSTEFFYFMMQSPDNLGATVTLRHPDLPGSIEVPIANKLMRFRLTISNDDLRLNSFYMLRRNTGKLTDKLAEPHQFEREYMSLVSPTKSKNLPESMANFDRQSAKSKFSKSRPNNLNNLRSGCLDLLGSEFKSEGLNGKLCDNHKRELSGETSSWHNGELHLIIDMKDMLDSDPVRRRLCCPDLETHLLAEGPYNLPLSREILVHPGTTVVFLVEAPYLPLYADLLMELLEPASSQCYSINSSNLPSEMDIQSQKLPVERLNDSNPFNFNPEEQQGLVGINHLKSRKKCTFKFMVESDSLEGAYCYGMDMLEYTCRVSKLGQQGPDVTDLKRSIRKMEVDDSADGEKQFINDSDKEDTVMKYSQTAKRMLRHQPSQSQPAGLPTVLEHSGYDGPVCESSLFIRGSDDKCSLRCVFSDQGGFEDGEIKESVLAELIVDNIRKVYISGGEEFLSRMQATIPTLPYRNQQLQVLRFV